MDETRLKRQKEASNLFIEKDGIGAFQFPTGFGKTFTAILILKRFNKDKKVCVIVPTIPLKDQWLKELEDNKLYNVNVQIVNTYIKSLHKYDFIICDEAHKFSTNSAKYFNKVIDNTEYKYILCLSATFNKEQKEFLLERNIPILDSITLSEAVKNKWVSEYIEYNLALTLTKEEQVIYDTQSNIIKAHFGYFDSDLSTALKCMSDKEFRKQYCIDNGFDEKDIGMRATRLQGAMSKRKALIYGGKRKITIIKELLEKNPIKTIVFSETIKYCQEVHKTIKDISTVYHSTLKPIEKDKALANIKDNSNNIRAILTAKALDEGLDVEDIDCAIIASGTSVERQQVQRKGRAIRFMVGKLALIINLYYKDTMEETWLKKRQKGQLPAKWIESLDEIEYESINQSL